MVFGDLHAQESEPRYGGGYFSNRGFGSHPEPGWSAAMHLASAAMHLASAAIYFATNQAGCAAVGLPVGGGPLELGRLPLLRLEAAEDFDGFGELVMALQATLTQDARRGPRDELGEAALHPIAQEFLAQL